MKEMSDDFSKKLIFGKYKIIKNKGKSICSTVFSGINIINKKYVFLKVQDKNQKYGTLEKEAFYLIRLKGIGIPNIISYGFSGKYNILIEELLGNSLEQLFKENRNRPKRIRLKDMIMAGIQIIERLEFIHSKYIIHLDIKPNNFLVGKSNSSLI